MRPDSARGPAVVQGLPPPAPWHPISQEKKANAEQQGAERLPSRDRNPTEQPVAKRRQRCGKTTKLPAIGQKYPATQHGATGGSADGIFGEINFMRQSDVMGDAS